MIEWLASNVPSLLVGAALTLLIDKVFLPYLTDSWDRRKQRRQHADMNSKFAQFESLHPNLTLVQTGWDQEGCFPEDTVQIQREANAFQPDALCVELRSAHEAEWEKTYNDGEQYGLRNYQVRRVSDDPHAELTGHAHLLSISSRAYSFFDFLATHRLRLEGSPSEREQLTLLAADAGPEQSSPAFPTPLSVGLSMLCEGGNILAVPRRSDKKGSAGDWAPGKIFNAVGENLCERDFTSNNGPVGQSTAHAVARRGLHEEMGWSDSDLAATPVKIHSFAWASDALDFKFFGYAISSLSFAETQQRWRQAPDRGETKGVNLIRFPAASRAECLDIVRHIQSSGDWATEGAFCTVFTLLSLGRVSVRDILSVLPDLDDANAENGAQPGKTSA